MKDALRSWPFLFISLLLVTVVLVLLARSSSSRYASADRLVGLLPDSEAVIFYSDIGALRQSGFLKLTEAAKGQDADYAKFVSETGFAYQRDLDAVAVSAGRNQFFAVARGRFDWSKLIQYAVTHGGKCQNRYCRTPASQPGRWISFFPLRTHILGLAVSTDPEAAYRLSRHEEARRATVPAFPVWAKVPKTILEDRNALPPAMQVVTQALSSASSVTLGLEQATGGGPARAIRVRLSAPCEDGTAAVNLRDHLAQLTQMLKASGRRPAANGSDDSVAKLLSSGTFIVDRQTVEGQWLVPESVVKALSE